MAHILPRSPNTNNTTNAYRLNTNGNINNNNASNTNGARPALVDKVRPIKRKLKAAPPHIKGSHILPPKGQIQCTDAPFLTGSGTVTNKTATTSVAAGWTVQHRDLLRRRWRLLL